MDDRDARRPRAEAEPGGLSPIRAFVLLGTVAILVAAGVTVFRDTAPAEPRPTTGPSPDYSLTDAEAIAEFERLRTLAVAAVRNRDVSLIAQVFTTSGPLKRRASREIKTLLKKRVVDESVLTSLSADVVKNTPTEIVIRERSRLEVCFINAAGVDVSTGPAVVAQKAEWTLTLERDEWRLHDAVVIDDRAVNVAEARCG